MTEMRSVSKQSYFKKWLPIAAPQPYCRAPKPLLGGTSLFRVHRPSRRGAAVRRKMQKIPDLRGDLSYLHGNFGRKILKIALTYVPCRPPFRGAQHEKKRTGKITVFRVVLVEDGTQRRCISCRAGPRPVLPRLGGPPVGSLGLLCNACNNKSVYFFIYTCIVAPPSTLPHHGFGFTRSAC